MGMRYYPILGIQTPPLKRLWVLPGSVCVRERNGKPEARRQVCGPDLQWSARPEGARPTVFMVLTMTNK